MIVYSFSKIVSALATKAGKWYVFAFSLGLGAGGCPESLSGSLFVVVVVVVAAAAADADALLQHVQYGPYYVTIIIII